MARSPPIRDTIPSGVTFVSATGGGTAASGVVTWNIGTVNAGATGTVSFTVTVTAASGAVTNSNFSIQGNGTAATSVRFYTELYVDGILRSNWYSDPPLLAPDSQFSYYVFVTDFSIGSLPAGTHTLRIKADSTRSSSRGPPAVRPTLP